MASFKNADYVNEFLVYAHGAPATKTEVLRQLEELSMRLYGDKSIRVGFDNDSSWPYLWYLRDYPNRVYFGENPDRSIADYPVVIVGSQNWGKVEPLLGNDYESRTYTFLWWPMEEYRQLSWNAILGDPAVDRAARRGIFNPEVRRALWDILVYRDYDAYASVYGGTYTAGQWPLRHDLRLYISRDALAGIWDYGLNAAAIEPPVDPYAENEFQLAPVLSFGESGAAPGALLRPRNIALAADGTIYVADSGNNRIQVFSPEGEYLYGWGTAGSEASQFSEPWGIAVDDEFVYVADTWNHRIQKFSLTGELVHVFGASGSPAAGETGGGLFYGPRDIIVLADGNLLISDTGNKRLQLFDPDGNFLQSIGSEGSQIGQFKEPVGLGASPEGNIYVADTWNGRIQQFTPEFFPFFDWQVEAWFGQSIENKPYLAVDVQGRVYVSDPEGARILIFDATGRYLGRFGRPGASTTELGLPNGLALSPDGHLFVVDSQNNRILKFEAPFENAPAEPQLEEEGAIEVGPTEVDEDGAGPTPAG
jgi:DNA-binding beta-propeller fold protein YncE